MSASPSKSDQLEQRLIAFGATIVSLSAKMPKDLQGRHISNQIFRSGTAPAANYGEARGAESRADFVHKLKVVFKELNETTIWLELIAQAKLLPEKIVAPVLGESRQLCRIIATSIKTARNAK